MKNRIVGRYKKLNEYGFGTFLNNVFVHGNEGNDILMMDYVGLLDYKTDYNHTKEFLDGIEQKIHIEIHNR